MVLKLKVFLRELYGLLTKTIRSAKVFGPRKSKVYGLIWKSIRSVDGIYTVCESIRSSIIDVSYDVIVESTQSLNLTHNRCVILREKRKVYLAFLLPPI